MTPMSNEPQALTSPPPGPYELQIIKLEECTSYPPELLALRGRRSAIWSSEYSSSGDGSDEDEEESAEEEYCSSEEEAEDESTKAHQDRATKRILSWRNGFAFTGTPPEDAPAEPFEDYNWEEDALSITKPAACESAATASTFPYSDSSMSSAISSSKDRDAEP